MNLQQMKYISEVVRQDLSVSAAARALNTSQPAITKQLKQLENELGRPLFVRHSNRLVRLTPVGQRVVNLAQRVCLTINEIKLAAQEDTDGREGLIRIATTHAHAQFVLPEPMQRFSKLYKHARFELQRALASEITALVRSGDADLGVTPENVQDPKDVIFLHYESYPRLVLFPKSYSALAKKPVTLKALADYPIIITGRGFLGRTDVMNVFTANGIKPNIQLSAPDFDVVKACVKKKLGIAIMPSYTYDRKEDSEIRAVDASHLFPPSYTNVVIRKTPSFRPIVQQFLKLLFPKSV
jgi:LysR family cys regulon transcriptional activator